MSSEVTSDVGTLDLVLRAAVMCDNGNFDAIRSFKQRHGVSNRADSGSAAIPADHDTVELKRRLVDGRHNNHRPPGVEQCAFNYHVFNGATVRGGLIDNSEIEAPRDRAEATTDPRKTCPKHHRFGGDAHSRGRLAKSIKSRLCFRLVIAPLSLDDVSGDVAQVGNQIEWVVDEGD